MSFFESLLDALSNKDYSDGVKCPVCNACAYWDEDEARWVCSSCGYEIHGDQLQLDKHGNVEKTLEIDWYCDECGAYLNDQLNFNPYDNEWTCTECGYVNDITKDNVW